MCEDHLEVQWYHKTPSDLVLDPRQVGWEDALDRPTGKYSAASTSKLTDMRGNHTHSSKRRKRPRAQRIGSGSDDGTDVIDITNVELLLDVSQGMHTEASHSSRKEAGQSIAEKGKDSSAKKQKRSKDLEAGRHFPWILLTSQTVYPGRHYWHNTKTAEKEWLLPPAPAGQGK